MDPNKKFYLVAEEILPEAMLKTVLVKDMMSRGEIQTVHEAVAQVELSRSAFYKYKDLVFSYTDSNARKFLTILLILEHRQGVLSTVLNTIASVQGNIVTINQGVPMTEAALATATVDLSMANVSSHELVKLLENLAGVRKAEIVGFSS